MGSTPTVSTLKIGRKSKIPSKIKGLGLFFISIFLPFMGIKMYILGMFRVDFCVDFFTRKIQQNQVLRLVVHLSKHVYNCAS